MKRTIRIFCFVIAIGMLFALSAYAEEGNTYSSIYFHSYDSSIRNPSDSTLEIWFDVVSNGAMDELGVSSIELECCPNGNNWTVVKTFLPEDYPQMIRENTSITYDCVTYTGMYDYSYRAHVTFYAKNYRGEGYMTQYSEVYYIPLR